MGALLLHNVRCVFRDGVRPGSLLCEEGKIRRFLPVGEVPPPAAEVLEGEGRYLAPGYIDLHIHGLQGFVAEQGPESLQQICRILPEYGVTGFLPTLTPQPDDAVLLKSLASIPKTGAENLGFFLEGHYLKLNGAIPGKNSDYSLSFLERLYESAAPYNLVLGVSPEIPEVVGLLPRIAKSGYPAFVTHTCAGVEQTRQAIALGATHATHFYDVFPYPGDKEGGVRGCGAVEAFLAAPGTTVDFILDGEHVQPVAVQMALRCLGEENVCLITDANINAGMPPGNYVGLGGTPVVVEHPGGPARMSGETATPGALTGSGLTLDVAVQNAVRLLGLPLHKAVAMSSHNPAKVLGLEKRKGDLAPGFDADFSLLDDSYQVTACYVGGVPCYNKTDVQTAR